MTPFWVISKRLEGSARVFFAMDLGSMVWSTYVGDAVQFSREQDAEALMELAFFEFDDVKAQEYSPCNQ